MEKIKKFLFVNTNNKQTIIKNTLWLFVGEFGIKFLKLIIFVYAARKLGTIEWGAFSYILALLATFNIFSDIGLNSVLLKKASVENEERQKYISTGFLLKLGLSLISSLALLSLILFLENDKHTIKMLIPIASLVLFLDTIREFGFSLNRSTERMEIEAIIKIITMIILIIAGFILLKINPIALSLLYAYVISSFIGLFIIYLKLKTFFKKPVKYFTKKLLIPIWTEAWPVGIVATIGTIMTSIDIIILGWFSSLDQIGIYSTAQKLIQVLYVIPALISVAILPLFSRYANQDIKKVKEMTREIIKKSFWATIPIILVCSLFGNYIVTFLFGNQYIDSVNIFKIMSFAIIVGAPSAIVSNAIFASGKQKKLIQFILISLISNIVFCLLTIPKFGITGAAVSVTLAQIIGNLFLMLNYKKYIR